MRTFMAMIGVGVLLLCFILPMPKAFACSCAEGTALEKLNRSSIVFLGEVIEVGKGTRKGDIGPLREYTFELKQSWKGNNNRRVSIFSYVGDSASCGISFNKKTSYLVYAYQGKDGSLQTNLCSGNLTLVEAGNEIALLGQSNRIVENPAASEDGAHRFIQNKLLYAGMVLLLIAGLTVWAFIRKRRSRV